MATQKLIWTALPGGERDGKLRLSALVSPRLNANVSEGDELVLWPTWVNWTERVRDAKFKVAFGGGPTIDAEFDKTKLEPQLWSKLFNDKTFVRPHAMDNYSGRNIISYPARQMHRSLKRLYQEAGTRAPEGITPAAPLTWDTEYIDLGKGNQPSAHIMGIATSGRFIYATHQPYTPGATPDPNRPFGRLVKIDSESRQIVAEVGIGDGPRSVAIMPDRTDPSKNRIYVVNAGIGKTINGVNNVGGSSLMIIKENGNSLEQPVEKKIIGGPVDVAVSFARNHVYVTNHFGRKLEILDADTLSEESVSTPDDNQTDEKNQEMVSIAVDDDDAVYVTIAEVGGLEPPPGTVLSTKVVKLVPQDAKTYRRDWKTTIPPMRSLPVRIAVDSERNRVYVTHNPGLGQPVLPGVTILDSATGAVVAVHEMGGPLVLNVAVSPHFRYAYALRHQEVTAIGPGNRVIDHIPHGLNGNEGKVTVLPETEQVLVGGSADSRIMIATPSSTDAPEDLDDLLGGWDVPWTAEAEQAARDNLGNADVEDRDLTSRLLLFHRRPPEDEVELPQAEALRTLLDFHEALSSLGDYPDIMRRLGLIVDLTIPAQSVPTGDHLVRVLPTLPAAPGPVPEHKFVATAARWDGTKFTARSQTGEIADSLLVLDDERYELQQLDLDGATLKLVNAAATLGRVKPGDALRQTLPALRTGGIGLIRNEHAAALRQQFNRSINHDNALAEQGDTVLFAEDLLRGYRVDVWDGTSKTWHSLCQRDGTYTFGTGAQAETRKVRDEGVVDISVSEAAAPKPAAPNDLYLHEAVTEWNGWSLVAPRPGKSAADDGQPEEDDNEPVTPFKLRVDFTAVQGTLPKLRFGETYRVRGRTVDLAGNSLALEDAPDVGLPEQPGRFAYFRYEPVPAPAVVLREPITEEDTPGEALERLVLRTSNTNIAADTAPSDAITERHIAAPRASQLFVETHGAIDRNGKLQADADTYRMLAKRDAGQFAVDTETDMPVEGTERLEVPYLPDPLSRGATLRDLPGAPAGTIGTVENGSLVYAPLADGVARRGSATRLGWDAAWPELRPFRIVVRDGAGAPEWNRAARVLTIKLPKGEMARVPLSSFMNEEDLKLMAVWHWLREYADEETRRMWERVDASDPATLDKLARQLAESAHYALYGGHAMLTPARELVLVHAVQQPLGRPVWGSLLAQREERETAIRLAGGLQIHGKSTGSVELRARWDEAVDDVREGPPASRPSQAVVLDIPIPRPAAHDAPNQPFVTIRTGGRRVARYYGAEDRLEFVKGAQPEHAFSDTKHRVVRYRAAATSSFREYFARDARGSFERESDEVIVDVPSSARPAAPRVCYVVPTFGWERSTDSNLISSRRRGHGLRVYLDRPWYSSGEGELLGVVIWPRSLNDADRIRLKGSISQAGADPVFVSSGRAALNRASFGTEGITWGNRLQLPGLNANETVDVAGHAVGYNAERDLWYCDITFDPNIGRNTEAYGAFVRLALVRFQPDSLAGFELSRPVTTEFMQVAPDRSAVATYDPFEPGSVRLVVAGQTYRATLDEANRIRSDGTFVQVSVEERRADVRNELGWHPAQAGRVSITADAVHSADTVLWQGRIKLPADRAPGRFRVVIKEFEPWLDDGALQSLGSGQLAPRARRLVYAETIVL
jgi:DNA-binding beta-propeller fold protein YncE